MKGNPVIWFEIYVQDMGRAKRFYESVFEVQLQRLNSPDMDLWAFPMHMEQVGSGGALVKMDGVASGGNSTIVYFHSEDCSLEAARIIGAGGRIQMEKTSIGEHGFIALGFDTEGNLFGIHSMA